MPDRERPDIPPIETDTAVSYEPRLSPAMMARLTLTELAVVATLDDWGTPCAWPLSGEPGLVRPLGPDLLRVLPPTAPPLELAWQITRSPSLGLLSLDLDGGSAVLVGGVAALVGRRLMVAVERARHDGGDRRCRLEAVPVVEPVLIAEPRLDRWQRNLIRRSATAFLVTRNGRGDLHVELRRGWPGFVDASRDDRLSLPLPAGDQGAVRAHSLRQDTRACVLFLDRDAPGWLQVSVRATPEDCNGRAALGDARLSCHVTAAVQAFGTASV